MLKFTAPLALVMTALAASASAQALPSVFLEELTWTEVRDAVESGTTTIIVPTAGTEQNGPHMVLGKHKFIINAASERIAQELGDTLVAPVVTYVPEGDVENPRGHMTKAGTITLPTEFFEKLLEYAARSLVVHGFTDIVLIGDSGGNQRGMESVAARLNELWRTTRARVHFVPEYYSANGFQEWLLEQGETEESIGTHAGIRDTSQLWAVAPQHVRPELMAPNGGMDDSGVRGDPTRASIEYGRMGMKLKVETAVRKIRLARGR